MDDDVKSDTGSVSDLPNEEPVRQRTKSVFITAVVVLAVGSIIIPTAFYGYKPHLSYASAAIGVMGGVYFKWVSPKKEECPWLVPFIYGLLTLLSLLLTQALTLYRLIESQLWLIATALLIMIELVIWYMIAENVIGDHAQIFRKIPFRNRHP